jgi:hypothetical protein
LIAIEPKEPGPEWNQWEQEANKETRQIIEDTDNGKPLKFKERIWKKLKPFLDNLFKKKCAYCEGIYEGGTWMDVEHYRPKAKVTLDGNPQNIVKITDAKGEEIEHPGYYWLAYDWRNLLLSCKKCNSGKGKMNQFPINGRRATSPLDSLQEEDPLILNPYDGFKTEEHLNFRPNGFVAGITEKGKTTVKTCNLNREELQTSRQREGEKCKKNLLLELMHGGDSKIATRDMEYSAYLRVALKAYIDQLAQEAEKRI